MSDISLGSDINAVARLTGTFTLRSGQISNEYFDKYRFEADPKLLRRVASRMLELLPAGTELLAGLELGGVPIATAMSLESGLPVVFVRKEAKTYGTCQCVEGGAVSGRKIAIVEDVITTGGAVADASRMLLKDGAQILGVVCAIWRGKGAPHIAGNLDLTVIPALTVADLK
jgi:orotate phosphoribosyltransferase